MRQTFYTLYLKGCRTKEELKQKSRTHWGNLVIGWKLRQAVPSLPSGNRTLILAVKNDGKAEFCFQNFLAMSYLFYHN